MLRELLYRAAAKSSRALVVIASDHCLSKIVVFSYSFQTLNMHKLAIKQGIMDSLNFPFALFILYGSHKILELTLKSVATTFCVYFLVTTLRFLMTVTIASQFDDGIKALASFVSCTISVLLNQSTHRQLAMEARILLGGKKQQQRTKLSELLRLVLLKSMLPNMVHQSYRLLLLSVYLAISFIYIFSFPWIGPLIGQYHLGMLWSFVCFEPYFVSLGWKLPRTIRFFEERWLYFTGYGTFT